MAMAYLYVRMCVISVVTTPKVQDCLRLYKKLGHMWGLSSACCLGSFVLLLLTFSM